MYTLHAFSCNDIVLNKIVTKLNTIPGSAIEPNIVCVLPALGPPAKNKPWL